MSAIHSLDSPVGEYRAKVTTKYPNHALVDFGPGSTSYVALPDALTRPILPPPGNYVATLALRENGGSVLVALRPMVGVVVPLLVPLERLNLQAGIQERLHNAEVIPQKDVTPTSSSLVKTDDATKLRVLVLKATTLYTDDTLTAMRPNYGVAVVCTWDLLAKFLSEFKCGDPGRYPDPDIAKRQWGGWVGGAFKDNHRTTESFVSTQLLIVDVDGGADVQRLARLLSGNRVMVHTTYKSTESDPRARVVFMLSNTCTDAARYKTAHAIVRAMLKSKGFVLDDGASDCSRLNFIPMHRPGYSPQFHVHDGELLDIEKLVQPMPEPEPAARRPTSSSNGQHGDAYRTAAMRKAHDSLAAAVGGARHNTLVKEAWSLARIELGLTIQDIEDALLPAYEHDLADGTRTIRDEFRARRRRTP